MPSDRRAARGSASTTRELRVAPPFALDLTVSALRRTATNLVDVYTPAGRYLRALGGLAKPVVVSVRQVRRDALEVSVSGPASRADMGVNAVRRMLGTDRLVSDFHRHANRIAWLAPLARRLRGLRPPRYPNLFESCANAIVFQQVSLHAATSIMRRLLLAIAPTTEYDGIPLVVFPSSARLLEARDAELRGAGLSANKVATLRRAAEAIESGAISEAMLDELPSEEAALLLRGIKGIGPWTAAVILLRGLGRVDVFPGGDSGVAASLSLVTKRRIDSARLVERLGSQRGMLYFCLLLARLEARGEIGRPSVVAVRS